MTARIVRGNGSRTRPQASASARETDSRYSIAVLQLVSHPIADDCLVQLRDVNTPAEQFRTLTDRITLVLGAAALATLRQRPVQVTTPLGPADGRRIDGDVGSVPVLRAGLAMLPGFLQLVPLARVGFIGLRRDEETAVASCYFDRLPEDIEGSHVILADPMLATGGSATAALKLLRAAGAGSVTLVCIVAAPEGVAAVEGAFPEVRIVTPVIDRELNARKFIVPGLGDFGDRLYGTR